MFKPVPMRELLPEDLRPVVLIDKFPFVTTATVEPLAGIIGQERAVKAIQFGLRINKHGYNIYLAGQTGTGKTSYARSYVESVARQGLIPNDWCYVYNFSQPSQPKALSLPPGYTRRLADDMEELIDDLKTEIPRAFSGEDYDRQKNALLKTFQEKSTSLIEHLNEDAGRYGFTVRRNSTGFVTVPLMDGKPIAQEEFENMAPEQLEDLERRSTEVQTMVQETIRRIQIAEKETREKVRELNNKTGLFAVGHLIRALQEKYVGLPQVVSYLEQVQEDVLANLSSFSEEEKEDQLQQQFPWLRRMRTAVFQKYRINVLVDNCATAGSPVVYETNPTYYNLIGRLEHENELGVITTDFTMIRAGAMHRANGGYLILQARDVLTNPGSWEALKRVLKTSQLRIENMGDQFGLVAMSTLKPEPIPISLKVILIGSSYIYHLLHHLDEDFPKLFKVKVDFDDEMPLTTENIANLARFISYHCQEQGLHHFHKEAVGRVAEYSSRLASSQKKMSTRFNEIVEILYEADAWANLDGSEFVERGHVEQAIREKVNRSNRIEEKILELFRDGTLLLSTTDRVVGQVNGLSILDMGDYYFGKPSRITAVTSLGARGIINIEREVHQSGPSHSKGVLILSGFLAEKYAKQVPLSISASICFEQTYEGVNGDSASSTELYALLSSLSGLPLDQGIAVTGSVNQKGDIQPVGGITQKIEGFYHVCKLKGLSGCQGVIIPTQNVSDLVLKDEVVDAVSKGFFHIYPVASIDEGLEILTKTPAGEMQKDGSFPQGTVHYLVAQNLRQCAETLARFGDKDSPEEKDEDQEIAATDAIKTGEE